MKKTPIDPKEASLAATFYEPVYQRLRLWHHGQAMDLLCFAAETNERTKQLLGESGAAASLAFRAGCFAEIWELPHDELLATRFGSEPAAFDQAITAAIGCQHGKFPATAGLMQWGDNHEQANQRRHHFSRLLQESLASRRRSR